MIPIISKELSRAHGAQLILDQAITAVAANCPSDTCLTVPNCTTRSNEAIKAVAAAHVA